MKKLIIFIIFFISNFSFAQEEVKVDLSNPNATIYTHLYFLQKDSYFPEKAAKTINGLEEEQAIHKVIKLKKILDGKGLKVEFSKIPTDKNYSDSTAISGSRYVLFPYQLPKIYVEKMGDNWYYSKETVALIDSLYETTFPWQTQWISTMLPESVAHKTFLGIQAWQYLGLFILSLLSFIIFYIFNPLLKIILKRIKKWIFSATKDYTNITFINLARPLAFLLVIAFIKRIIPSFQFDIDTNKYIFLGLNIAQTVFWIYVFLKLVHVVMSIYAEFTLKTHAKLDDQLVPILNKFLTGIVFFLGALKLLTLFGVNIKAVVMGASIGGLALALASQDTVKNLIGTFMIFLDKPFHIGDWIVADGVEGSVEEVGFRSTRLRAADTSIYQIPNSKLSEITINNKGLRKFRRYTTKLGIRYDTPPELIDAFVAGIREIIVVHPCADAHKHNVEFIAFGDSALQVLLNVYFKVLDWDEEQTAKHDLHMAILKLATNLNIGFAFPSQTLYMEQFPEKKDAFPVYNTQPEFAQQQIDITVQELANIFKNRKK